MFLIFTRQKDIQNVPCANSDPHIIQEWKHTLILYIQKVEKRNSSAIIVLTGKLCEICGIEDFKTNHGVGKLTNELKT